MVQGSAICLKWTLLLYASCPVQCISIPLDCIGTYNPSLYHAQLLGFLWERLLFPFTALLNLPFHMCQKETTVGKNLHERMFIYSCAFKKALSSSWHKACYCFVLLWSTRMKFYLQFLNGFFFFKCHAEVEEPLVKIFVLKFVPGEIC